MDIPTVGRRVWYWPRDEERSIGESTQPFDAGVTYVHSATLVNLSITNEFGNPQHGKSSVTLTSYDTRMPGAASWMPYQEKVSAEKLMPNSSGPVSIADSAGIAAELSGGDLKAG